MSRDGIETGGKICGWVVLSPLRMAFWIGSASTFGLFQHAM
jgi:hypothetical protein